MSEVNLGDVATAIVIVFTGLAAYFSRKGSKSSTEAKDNSAETKDTLRNGVSDRLRRIESKVDRQGERLNDHIEAHRERAR